MFTVPLDANDQVDHHAPTNIEPVPSTISLQFAHESVYELPASIIVPVDPIAVTLGASRSTTSTVLIAVPVLPALST